MDMLYKPLQLFSKQTETQGIGTTERMGFVQINNGEETKLNTENYKTSPPPRSYQFCVQARYVLCLTLPLAYHNF